MRHDGAEVRHAGGKVQPGDGPYVIGCPIRTKHGPVGFDVKYRIGRDAGNPVVHAADAADAVQPQMRQSVLRGIVAVAADDMREAGGIAGGELGQRLFRIIYREAVVPGQRMAEGDVLPDERIGKGDLVPRYVLRLEPEGFEVRAVVGGVPAQYGEDIALVIAGETDNAF